MSGSAADANAGARPAANPRAFLQQPAALWLLALGALLRILLVLFPRPLDDDTDVYAELGRNLLHAGTYGMADSGIISPSLFRLPGYPLILGLLGGNIPLVLALQITLDLTACVLLTLLVLSRVSARAAWWTLALSTTCLFTSIYAAIPMTESLSVFAVAGALWAISRALAQPALYATGNYRLTFLALLPLAGFSGLAMLLRPDGALVTIAAAAALTWYGLRRGFRGRAVVAAALFCLLAAVPLIPWTVRNELTFHTFQPLAPRHVNDPGERVNLGFYRWMRTWAWEFSTTGQVYWHVGSEPIDLADLPSRAFDSPDERTLTAALIARYNEHHQVDQPLDDDFNALAATRIHANPLRYFVELPVMRVADMALRPRTDGTYLPSDWAALTPAQWPQVVSLGLLNLLYMAAALAAVLTPRTRRLLPAGAFMAFYIALRCALLATLENAEPRYTLEAYPIVLVCAAVWLADRSASRIP